MTPDSPQTDLALWMPCPMCGHRVRFVSGDEGTSHFEPVEPDDREHEARAAFAARLREAVEGLPGINAPRSPDQPEDFHHWKAWDEIVAAIEEVSK